MLLLSVIIITNVISVSVCISEGVSIGGEPACYIIEKHLSRFIEGQVSRHL